MSYRVSEAGAWSVHTGKRVTDDGVDQGTVISDGREELFTLESVAELAVAIMLHLGIERIEAPNANDADHH